MADSKATNSGTAQSAPKKVKIFTRIDKIMKLIKVLSDFKITKEEALELINLIYD